MGFAAMDPWVAVYLPDREDSEARAASPLRRPVVLGCVPCSLEPTWNPHPGPPGVADSGF